jgi:hypothetical protein
MNVYVPSAIDAESDEEEEYDGGNELCDTVEYAFQHCANYVGRNKTEEVEDSD